MMRARIRTVKPEIMSDEELWDLEVEANGGEPKAPLYRAFQGLWMLADREGRFEWRPRRLGRQILPYWKGDFEEIMQFLERERYILRYEVGGQTYGIVRTLPKNQRFNNREPQSVLPEPPANTLGSDDTPTDLSALEHAEANEKQDSSARKRGTSAHQRNGKGKGNGSRGSGSGSGSGTGKGSDPSGGVKPPRGVGPTVGDKSPGARAFDSYARDWRQRYNAEPLADPKVRSQFMHLANRLPAAEIDHVPGFYVSLNKQEYVANAHPVGLLIRDIDAIRMQWSTGRRITQSSARDIDQRDGLGADYRKALEELEDEEGVSHG